MSELKIIDDKNDGVKLTQADMVDGDFRYLKFSDSGCGVYKMRELKVAPYQKAMLIEPFLCYH